MKNKIDAIDINKIWRQSNKKQRRSPFESESYLKLPIFLPRWRVSKRQNGILVRIDFQFRTITLLSNLIFVVGNISYYFSIIYIDSKNITGGMLRLEALVGLGYYIYRNTWWLYLEWSVPMLYRCREKFLCWKGLLFHK